MIEFPSETRTRDGLDSTVNIPDTQDLSRESWILSFDLEELLAIFAYESITA